MASAILYTICNWIKKLRFVILVFILLATAGTAYFALSLLDETTISLQAPSGTKAYDADQVFNEYFNDYPGGVKPISQVIVLSFAEETPDESIINDFIEDISNSIVQKLTIDYDKHEQVVAVAGYYTTIDKFKPMANYFVSESKASMMMLVVYESSIGSNAVRYIYDILENLNTDHGKYVYATTGMKAVEVDILTTITQDLVRMVYTSLPVALLLLIFILQSLPLMLIPVTVLLCTVVLSFATVYPFAKYSLDVATFNPPIMVTFIVAMCIDYALFLLTRFKEEIKIGKTNDEAVAEMLIHSGRIVITSGSVLFLCFASLAFFPVSIVYTFGISASVALFYSVVLSLLLTPAMLYIGKSFFMSPFPCVPKCRMHKQIEDEQIDASAETTYLLSQNETINNSQEKALVLNDDKESEDPEKTGKIAQILDYFTLITTAEEMEKKEIDSFWFKFGTYLVRPKFGILAIIVVLVVTIPFIVFVKDFRVTLDDSLVENENGLSTIGMQELQKGFSPGIIALYQPIIKAKSDKVVIKSDEGFAAINDYIRTILAKVDGIDSSSIMSVAYLGGEAISWEKAQKLMKMPGKVGKAYTKATEFLISKDNTASYFILTTTFDPKHNITDFVNTLRSVSEEYAETSDFDILIYSQYCDMQDAVDTIYNLFPFILSATAAVVILILLIVFRFVIIPFRTVITLAIVLGFSFGFACILFVGEGSDHALYWFTPICTFGVSIGITLDYDVFLFSRVAEFRTQGYSTDLAVKKGYQKGISVIFFAGLIMASAFAGLIPSKVGTLSQISLIWTVSVLVCTFLMSFLFQPSVLGLCGELNWWPRKFPTTIETITFPAEDNLSSIVYFGLG